MTLHASCITEPASFALTRTCKQIEHEIANHYSIGTDLRILIHNSKRRDYLWPENEVENEIPELPSFARLRSLRLNVCFAEDKDRTIQSQLAEDILTSIWQSTTLHEAHYFFDVCMGEGQDRGPATKLKADIGKLSMLVTRARRRKGDSAAQMDVDFVMKVIKLLKGPNSGSEARKDG